MSYGERGKERPKNCHGEEKKKEEEVIQIHLADGKLNAKERMQEIYRNFIFHEKK